MFRKDFRIKSNILSKNSEKKHLFENISKFYKIDTSILSNLFSKSKLNKIKVECHSGEFSTIYQFDEKPLFFEISSVLVPTVYCLWIMCDFVMSFTIHEETVPYILKGSDLMLPGVIVKKPIHEKSYGIFAKNELVSVNTNKNRSPIAIGMTTCDHLDMFMRAGRGKAVNILHTEGDYLWALGDKSSRPSIDWITPSDSVPENLSTIEDPVAILSEETESLSIAPKASLDEPEPSEICPESSEDDPDQVLLKSFLCALKYSVTDAELPLHLNILYARHVLKNCPPGQSIDLKRTRSKKFSAFVAEMQQQGLVTVANLGQGVQTITKVNRSHPELVDLPDTPLTDCTQSEPITNGYQFPKVSRTPQGIVQLEFADGRVTTIRNKRTSPKITIETVSKNNKLITRVDGHQVFGIEANALSSTVRRTLGCSCGEVTDRSNRVAVQAQGDQRVHIARLLREEFAVPEAFIDTVARK